MMIIWLIKNPAISVPSVKSAVLVLLATSSIVVIISVNRGNKLVLFLVTLVISILKLCSLLHIVSELLLLTDQRTTRPLIV